MAETTTRAIGVDIGGTGIKGAVVDMQAGAMATERVRILTPNPRPRTGSPRSWSSSSTRSENRARSGSPCPPWSWTASSTPPPTSTRSGSASTPTRCSRTPPAARSAWSTTPTPRASPRCASGPGGTSKGVVVLVTLGTGIGSAVFVDGVLVPNTELGHLPLHGADAEDWAAESIREEDDLSWKSWAHRVEKYLTLVDRLLWPQLIILGGGVSKKSDKFLPHIKVRTEVVPAQLHNDAGIVGAALFAPASGTAAGS